MPQRKFKSLVVVFVGEKLAGKEMAACYLARRHGFANYRFSLILDDILGRLGLKVSRLNEMNLAGALRERFGASVLAEAIRSSIRQRGLRRVVVDGLRHPAELDLLKSVPGFMLVYLTAPLEVRYRRALQRKEKAGESRFSLADFRREEKLPTEVFIHSLGRKTKVRLDNSGTLKDLYQQIEDKIVRKYIK